MNGSLLRSCRRCRRRYCAALRRRAGEGLPQPGQQLLVQQVWPVVLQSRVCVFAQACIYENQIKETPESLKSYGSRDVPTHPPTHPTNQPTNRPTTQPTCGQWPTSGSSAKVVAARLSPSPMKYLPTGPSRGVKGSVSLQGGVVGFVEVVEWVRVGVGVSVAGGRWDWVCGVGRVGACGCVGDVALSSVRIWKAVEHAGCSRLSCSVVEQLSLESRSAAGSPGHRRLTPRR
jgi:hypothetical protein